jgi:uncharacterized membrane protein
MNAAQIHLLLNHFPTVAFSIGIALFVIALLGKRNELIRPSLVIFFLSAAFTIATYVSGSEAQGLIKDSPGVSMPAISAHETAAFIGFTFMQATGFFAWIGLWLWRKRSRVAGWNLAVILLLSATTFGLMARAANIGGDIRHSEIRIAPDGEEGDSEATMLRTWGHYVENNNWVWPTAETLHFVGLCLLFGVVLAVDLRMLGMGKSLPFAALYQLLPLGMLGFTLNLVTGMMFFVATPQQYTGFLFFLKMMLVVVGAINVLYFMLVDAPWSIGEGDDAPVAAKLVAVSAIVIWIAVAFCGHMLPFFGNSF